MTPSPKRRLRLGCGEALGTVAVGVRRYSPPPVRASGPLGGAMPRLLIGVLKQR
jgi:hypothetical protein